MPGSPNPILSLLPSPPTEASGSQGPRPRERCVPGAAGPPQNRDAAGARDGQRSDAERLPERAGQAERELPALRPWLVQRPPQGLQEQPQ